MPERVIIWFWAGKATLTQRFIDTAPRAVGVRVMFIVQVAPAASELAQSFV